MAISTMLVPVGLEPRDERFLRYVCGLTCQSVEHVIVATVVQSTGLEAPILAAEVDRARERLVAIAHDLREQCEMEFELRVVTGDPADAILALARQTDVDVLCVGTEGKSFGSYLFEGSISEDLFSAGKVRTMAVRYDLLEAAEDPAKLSSGFAERLVVATDFSDSAHHAFDSAFDRPCDVIGELYILHVGEESDRALAQSKLDALCELAHARGVKARADFRVGDPAQATLDYLNQINATGVIIGQRGQTNPLRRFVFGWVPLRVLREAPCPVVVQP